MALTLPTTLFSTLAHHRLAQHREARGSLERLSSGSRISRAADDAAGLGVATTLGTHARSAEGALRNTGDGMAALAVAESGAAQIVDVLQRMRSLAVQSSSDTLQDPQRASLQTEFGALRDEIGRIAGDIEYNGLALGDGSLSAVQVQVGIHQDPPNRIEIQLGALTPFALGISGAGFHISTSTDARSTLDPIDAALATVSAQRSEYGALINRIDASLNHLHTWSRSVTDARARLMDADYAMESSNLVRSAILRRSGRASQLQARRMARAVVRLLR